MFAVWRFPEVHMNIMLIMMFFMYFADFWLIFEIFLTIVLFYCRKWVLKRPLLHEQILDNKWLQFCVMKHFLLRNMTKNGEN